MPGGPGQPGPLRRLPGSTILTAAVILNCRSDDLTNGIGQASQLLRKFNINII